MFWYSLSGTSVEFSDDSGACRVHASAIDASTGVMPASLNVWSASRYSDQVVGGLYGSRPTDSHSSTLMMYPEALPAYGIAYRRLPSGSSVCTRFLAISTMPSFSSSTIGSSVKSWNTPASANRP